MYALMCKVSLVFFGLVFIFFFKQKTAYEMRISDWSSDVCSSDLGDPRRLARPFDPTEHGGFAGFGKNRAFIVGDLAVGNIVAPAFEHPRRAMVEENDRRLVGHRAIGVLVGVGNRGEEAIGIDRKSTRLNSSH